MASVPEAWTTTMPASYNLKRCPVANTLDAIGERWTLLLIRDLIMEGPRKFQDFQRTLPGISPNTLSDRLKGLEEDGIITRRFYEDHPPRAEYLLTEKGRHLGPVMKALLEWGERYTMGGRASKVKLP